MVVVSSGIEKGWYIQAILAMDILFFIKLKIVGFQELRLLFFKTKSKQSNGKKIFRNKVAKNSVRCLNTSF
jgi:hypothetical protein